MGRAGLRAGGGLAGAEALVAHVAFADDAESRAVFRHVVGALQHAILAADALVIEMTHDAGDRILFVSEHRTAVEAAGIGAMVAGGGDGLLIGCGGGTAVHEADIAPGFVVLKTVEGVAGDHAGLAAAAGVQVDLKGVLLARSGPGERDEALEIYRFSFTIYDLVEGGARADDRGLQPALFGQEIGKKGAKGLTVGDHYSEWAL